MSCAEESLKCRTRNVTILPGAREGPGRNIQPVRRLNPAVVEELSDLNSNPNAEEIFIFHNERPVVSELVFKGFERREPFHGPFLAAIAPAASPLALSPGIAYFDKAFSVIFNGHQHTICMLANKT